jgi:hypothetical protein
MGVVMDGIAGAPKDSVYLLELAFKWNGQVLHAGRGPLYGFEVPSDDMHPGSEPRLPEVYDLSPFPVRYPALLQAARPSFSIHFQPAQPIEKGTLHIDIRLVSSPEALGLWIKNGVGRTEDDLGEWTRRLAGPMPKTMEFEIRERSRSFKEEGTAMEDSSLGRYKLVPGQPTDIILEIPALRASEERYEIVFPDFGFSWERRKSQLPLNWLKGGPAPIAAPAGAKPGADIPPKAKSSKPPFWQFWKRGE